jgi:hypothetical protein
MYRHYKLDEQLREIKPPYRGIDFAIKNMKDHLAIVVKEEQVMNLTPEQQVSVMEWLQTLRTKVESFGIKCELMGRKYRGN